MALCQDAAMKDTMNSYVLGSAMDTAASADTPAFASCCWNAFTSAANFLYETVKAGVPGTMMAVDGESLEKACSKVVGDIVITSWIWSTRSVRWFSHIGGFIWVYLSSFMACKANIYRFYTNTKACSDVSIVVFKGELSDVGNGSTGKTGR